VFREDKAVFKPDNVYGNEPPVDILAEEDDDESFWGQSSSPSGTPSKPSKSAVISMPKYDQEYVV
jgi:hypothetical protein